MYRLICRDDERESIAFLLCSIGGVHERQAEFDKALELLGEALEIYKCLSGPSERGGSERAASVVHSIASVHEATGHYVKAIEMYKMGLEMRRSVSGGGGEQEGSTVADSLQCIGNVYYKIAEFAASSTYLSMSFDIYKMVFAESNPDVAVSLSKIGLSYKNLGMF